MNRNACGGTSKVPFHKILSLIIASDIDEMKPVNLIYCSMFKTRVNHVGWVVYVKTSLLFLLSKSVVYDFFFILKMTSCFLIFEKEFSQNQRKFWSSFVPKFFISFGFLGFLYFFLETFFMHLNTIIACAVIFITIFSINLHLVFIPNNYLELKTNSIWFFICNCCELHFLSCNFIKLKN